MVHCSGQHGVIRNSVFAIERLMLLVMNEPRKTRDSIMCSQRHHSVVGFLLNPLRLLTDRISFIDRNLPWLKTLSSSSFMFIVPKVFVFVCAVKMWVCKTMVAQNAACMTTEMA